MINLSPHVEDCLTRLDGLAVHYTARGPARAPLTLVGANGLAGGGDSFWPLLGGVPERIRVLLPDLPGCGESDPLPTRHTVQAYADWFHHFLDAQQVDRAVLISVATGAPISIRLAAQHPARVAGLIFSLPFLGRGALPRAARPVVAYALRLGPLRHLIDRLRQSNALMHRIITHQPPAAIPELAERDIAHKQTASLRATGDLLHDLMLLDSRAELPALRIPMLFLAAEHDAFSPLPVLERIVRHRPERRLYVERGGIHSWTYAFIAAMQTEIQDFLATLEGAAHVAA